MGLSFEHQVLMAMRERKMYLVQSLGNTRTFPNKFAPKCLSQTVSCLCLCLLVRALSILEQGGESF